MNDPESHRADVHGVGQCVGHVDQCVFWNFQVEVEPLPFDSVLGHGVQPPPLALQCQEPEQNPPLQQDSPPLLLRPRGPEIVPLACSPGPQGPGQHPGLLEAGQQ